MSTTFVGVYWAARADSLEDCAIRAQSHFRALAEASPLLGRWYRKAWRKPRNPVEVQVADTAQLEALLLSGVNRNDVDRTPIVELGWSLSVWNGEDEDGGADTTIHCGCTSRPVGNNAIVSVSRDATEGLEAAAALLLLKRLILIWKPDTGVVARGWWDEKAERAEEIELFAYKRRFFPVSFKRRAVPFADGIIEEGRHGGRMPA